MQRLDAVFEGRAQVLPDNQDSYEALLEAQARIEVLTQQVALVEQLKTHMREQDDLIAKLQSLVAGNRQAQDEERLKLIAQTEKLREMLAAAEEELAKKTQAQEAAEKELAKKAKAQQAEEAQQKVVQELQQKLLGQRQLEDRVHTVVKQLTEREVQLSALQTKLTEAEKQLDEAQSEAAKARAELKEAAVKLSTNLSEYQAWEVEQQQQQQQQQAKGKGGKKGFGKGKQRTPDAEQLAQQQAAKIKAALKEAQDQLQAQEVKVQECEKVVVARSTVVQDLEQQYKEQISELQAAISDASRLQGELGAQGVGGADGAVAALMTGAQVQELEALRKQIEALNTERDKLIAERDSITTESDRLRGVIGEVEALNAAQDAALKQLEKDLQELHSEVAAATSMRGDLHMLAEAFQETEAEVAALRASLTLAQEGEPSLHKELAAITAREATAQAELKETKQWVTSLQDSLGKINSQNKLLEERAKAAEAALRSTDRSARTTESRSAEMESNLVAFSQEIMALKGELAQKTHNIVELTERVKLAEKAESEQRTRAEAAASEMESMRKQALVRSSETETLSKQLVTARTELEKFKLNEDALRGLKMQLAEREMQLKDAQVARQALANELSQLTTKLEQSLAEVQSLRTTDATRSAELSEAQQTIARLNRELEQKQKGIKESLAVQASREQAQLLEVKSKVEAMSVLLGEKDSQLTRVVQEGAALRVDLATARDQVSELTRQLDDARRESSGQQEAAEAARKAARQTEEALLVVKNEVQKEAQAAAELLAKAEFLLTRERFSSAGITEREADEARALKLQSEQAAARNVELEKQMAALQAEVDLLRSQVTDRDRDRSATSSSDSQPTMLQIKTAQNRALASAAEAAALRERVKNLEEISRRKDAQMAEVLAVQRSGQTPQQIKELSKKVEELALENIELRRNVVKQEQLLAQTRKFLQGRVVLGRGNN